MLFYALAFLLPAAGRSDPLGYMLAAAVPATIFLGSMLLPRLLSADRLLMTLCNILCALGVLLLYVVQPELAIRQAVYYGIGLASMIFCVCWIRGSLFSDPIIYILALVFMFLLSLPIWFGIRTEESLNRISIGTSTLMPADFARIFLIPVFCALLSRRKMASALFCFLFCAGILLLLEKDLATAVQFLGAMLIVYWAFSGNLPFTLLGLGITVFLIWAAYSRDASLHALVSAWQNSSAGSTPLFAAGGLWGLGLDLAPETVEGASSFSLICSRFGLIFGGSVLLIYIALILRTADIAADARRSFHGLTATFAASLLGLQTVVHLCGAMNLLPVPDTVLPFISCDGFGLISAMCLLGLIQGVSGLNDEDLKDDRRR